MTFLQRYNKQRCFDEFFGVLTVQIALLVRILLASHSEKSNMAVKIF